ncbi:MAG: tRNA-2-methylthio-N(6)-dimethylallyladenosine synthase [Alphaproteobacteria bacterium MarineAlpha5_Bin12]|nr:tRNA (N6-isopentenyl adenosine(37)-C2)-methylthiotransferase MiaB [Pelagibacteraceae bacterium]PPR41166.1 MAG: tRNA-2-methylthio-N(6)-dimethylallyladenosine synthase [Alphaproteobacteria bacterium MarineAlpha5_Bin12]
MKKKIFIKSYGCQMNVYDSERMYDLTKPLGYEMVNDKSKADLIILNTCHIRDKASEKVYSDIGRIKKQVIEKNPKCKLIVAGCVAQAEGQEILNRSPIVNAVVGPQSYQNLPNILKKIDSEKNKIVNTDFESNLKFDNLNYEKNNSSTAFITVQEGCDKFCTFCVVPYTRGYEYSRPIEDIIKEIKKYAKSGVKEITLLGQNVNAYHGYDINKIERKLDYLINKISEINDIKRIRYMTSHPKDMNINLIKCHKDNSKLMPFLHLPIQSGSNKILKKMNRKYSVEEYEHTIDAIKSYRDDIAISSDFIVGFPGETDDDFDKTMSLINKIKFSIAYSFIYSPRPGTPATEIKDNNNLLIKKARLLALQTLLKKQQDDYNKLFVGKKLNVLIEKKGRNSNQFVGRSIYNQSVFMNSNTNIIGSIVKTKIINSTNFALSAEVI